MKTQWITLLVACGLATPCVYSAELITASDNAFVRKAAPTTDQDESSLLLLKDDGGNSNSRFSYLRFDITDRTAQDTVVLDLDMTSIASDVIRMDVWLLNDGVAGETTWTSTMTWNTRPDGTGILPNANVSEINSYGYENTGLINIPIPAALWQSAIANDTNDEITLILSSDAGNNSGVSNLRSIGNSSGIKPRLRILKGTETEVIEASTYGGELERDGHASGNMIYHDTWSSARLGTGGSGSADDYIHIFMFELPRQPLGGFLPEDTTFQARLRDEDVGGTQHADLWGIGYVPAEDIGDVGANLNDGGVTDIDDFFLRDADTETKVGWNIGTDNTEKIGDNLIHEQSTGFVGSPLSANTNITVFINDLFDNHGAEKGDYVVFRLNHDSTMGHVNNWRFWTGDAATTNKPVLTLTAAQPGGLLFSIK